MYEVRRFAELDSTNRYLLDEARAGAPAGLVAVADHQTAGRGRLDRRWLAPAGANLLASVLLRPPLPLEELHLCTVAVALAARAASYRSVGREPDLKWPNDLLVGEKKLAGILAETVLFSPGPGLAEGDDRAVVVGIGLNLAWPPPQGEGADPVPEELAGATSLWKESGKKVEPGVFLEILLAELAPLIGGLADGAGRRRLAADYRRACATLGRRVTVSLPNETVTGSVADITVEGHLLLDVGTCLRTITAGDVVHLRG
jgi:BirA family biotin operon repressor/biotin-[acetyl-CoA-carboxylase] ligase